MGSNSVGADIIGIGALEKLQIARNLFELFWIVFEDEKSMEVSVQENSYPIKFHVDYHQFQQAAIKIRSWLYLELDESCGK